MNQKRISVIAGSILLICMVAMGLQASSISQLTHRIEALNGQLDAQQNQIDQLENAIVQSGESEEVESELPWFWDLYAYPVSPKTLVSSLQGQEALIPYEGVLGGTIFFVLEEAQIIDPVYVYVPIEDGHMLGGVLLKYKIRSANQVEWQFVDGWWPDMN